ncbi:carbohydrate-binding protein [Acanthopleuribacter pedis]|uniref:Carbohydrate-binding protein n=1 Tax=Acanthopleuribacter pedis TaxID=442870 RepID=A0A8J7QKH9_9BACT|nr:carbohydrate-binding protein [Acanthopleuribacter pedis]MBO1322691.1 carbohydrate-binding protein [Acanthopleuribacter pedis]
MTFVCLKQGLCFLLLGVLSLSFAQNPTENFRQLATFDVGTFSLGATPLSFEITERRRDNRYEVVRGIVTEPGGVTVIELRNLTAVLDHETETLVGLLDLYTRSVSIDETGARRTNTKNKRGRPAEVCVAPHESHDASARTNKHPDILPVLPERDGSGRAIVDVLVGFSDRAAETVGDIEREALFQVETVNTSLLNSGVEDIFLRVVGAATHPANPGIIVEALNDGREWFAEEIEALAPDLIALMQMPTDAPGSAGGYAPVGGDISVNGVIWPTVLRHEIGHNVGASHCRDDNTSGYNFGYQPGYSFDAGTAMCGNSISIYSTPTVADNEGRLFGVEDAQDVTRVWRERIGFLSGRRSHRVPFEGEIIWPQHVEAEDYESAFDFTPGNLFGEYRGGDVDIRAYAFEEGYFVDWIMGGEYMTYPIASHEQTAATVTLRVASRHSWGNVYLAADGVILTRLAIPNTRGGWREVSTEIDLPAGTESLTVLADFGWFAFDWIRCERESLPTVSAPFHIENEWITGGFLSTVEGKVTYSRSGGEYSVWVLERAAAEPTIRLRHPDDREQYLQFDGERLSFGPLGAELEHADWLWEYHGLGTIWLRPVIDPNKTLNYERQIPEVSESEAGWWSARWWLRPINP